MSHDLSIIPPRRPYLMTPPLGALRGSDPRPGERAGALFTDPANCHLICGIVFSD